MTKTPLLKFLVLFLFVSPAFGQKVKYKDIFALLNTKQYELAEPFLKRYLVENDDNPNAFLFRAIIFHEKAGKSDILKQTALALSNMDSAIIFYNKAHETIDDREVRKNKEYYQAYNRRDLRTGEFGVKLSDIQFDIEKKIEGLRERIDRVKMTRHYFSLADTLYKKALAQYSALQEKFETQRHLYLRADENTINDLRLLSARFDSCAKAFESYKTISSTDNFGYNQVFSPVDIADFEKDGREPADFYSDQPLIWNYKQFADKSLGVIEKEIFPMRQHLITYDIEINKLRNKLESDSVSVRSDLTKLVDQLLYDQLKKYDPNPLPMQVFAAKTADLDYRSAVLEHQSLADSSDVHLQLSMAKTELKLVTRLDSLAGMIVIENLDEKAKDYQQFVDNTYNSTGVLKSYVRSLKDFADRELKIKQQTMWKREMALDWIADGADSIPLTLNHSGSRYKPLVIMDESYTAGLHFIDSANANGYFYTITPSREPVVKVIFPVDKAAFREKNLPVTKSIAYAEPSGQLYFVLTYSEQQGQGKYAATLAKIYRTDGLAWRQPLQLPFLPRELMFKPDTGELMIKNETQEVVVDKNGKVR